MRSEDFYMATSGDILPAIREDFYMATDSLLGRHLRSLFKRRCPLKTPEAAPWVTAI